MNENVQSASQPAIGIIEGGSIIERDFAYPKSHKFFYSPTQKILKRNTQLPLPTTKTFSEADAAYIEFQQKKGIKSGKTLQNVVQEQMDAGGENGFEHLREVSTFLRSVNQNDVADQIFARCVNSEHITAKEKALFMIDLANDISKRKGGDSDEQSVRAGQEEGLKHEALRVLSDASVKDSDRESIYRTTMKSSPNIKLTHGESNEYLRLAEATKNPEYLLLAYKTAAQRSPKDDKAAQRKIEFSEKYLALAKELGTPASEQYGVASNATHYYKHVLRELEQSGGTETEISSAKEDLATSERRKKTLLRQRASSLNQEIGEPSSAADPLSPQAVSDTIAGSTSGRKRTQGEAEMQQEAQAPTPVPSLRRSSRLAASTQPTASEQVASLTQAAAAEPALRRSRRIEQIEKRAKAPPKSGGARRTR